MKKIFKILCALTLINLALIGKSFASDDEKILKDELYQSVRDTIDGKLYYQVNIKTVYGPSDINSYRSNTDTDTLPAASTIKPYIGLAILDKVQKGEMDYTEEIKKDLDLSLRLSDNDATNRLIEEIGGFEEVNSYIKSFTKNDRTRLNRLMLGRGEENTSNAKDLAWALYEIYRNDNQIAKDMAKSLSKSSSKRVKLLKNVNPAYKTMNKTGEIAHIENDVALVDTGSQAYIISLMTENDDFMDTYNQVALINKLGEKVAKAYENYENAYKNKERLADEKLMARLDSQEKKLAYAVYKNQIFINAGQILLDSNMPAIDEIRPLLSDQIENSRAVLDKSKKTLANFSKEPIQSDEDMVVNLVRLLYTKRELNSDLDSNLALAFYKNKSTVMAGKIILKEAPKKSLGIRRPLLKNIRASEEILAKADKYFEKLNAEN